MTFFNALFALFLRLRGGIVFVDKLPRDPSGKLILNTAKYDKNAEMVDKDFLRSQPKVKVSMHSTYNSTVLNIHTVSTTYA